MSKIIIAFSIIVIIAGFALVLANSKDNQPTGAFSVDPVLVSDPIFLVGSLTLDSDFLAFLQQDKSLLFGGPFNSPQCFPKDFAVRDDFFEVNGILDCSSENCPGECEQLSNLKDEVLANLPSSEKERNLVLKILGEDVSDRNLEEELDCLTDVYSRQSLDVGSDTYFNIIKNCYVRAIKDLGILEQTYIDEPTAFFLVQKFEAIEVDLQHMLAIEDEKAKLAPILVSPPAITCEAWNDAASCTAGTPAPPDQQDCHTDIIGCGSDNFCCKTLCNLINSCDEGTCNMGSTVNGYGFCTITSGPTNCCVT